MLVDLISDNIVFSARYDLSLIESVSNCVVLPRDKCETKSPVCSYAKGKNRCQLIIPKKNLLTPTLDNETFYFSKMADELIRYSRVKAFIFEPQTFLSFENVQFNLRENEIILIQSLLTKEYFENMVPETQSTYVKYNTYDTAKPAIHQPYDNTVVLDNTYNLRDEDGTVSCDPTVVPISSIIWKKRFPVTFKELYYDKYNCGFALLAHIIFKAKGGRMKTVADIKTDLVVLYSSHPTYQQQIIDILILEGKRTQGLRVKQEIITLQQMIFLDDYFITNLDIWMICQKYKIPCVLISSKPILLTNKEKNVMTLYGNLQDSFVFINCPAMRSESIPKYSIFVDEKEEKDYDVFYDLGIFKDVPADELRDLNDSIENKQVISTFLNDFDRKAITRREKKEQDQEQKQEQDQEKDDKGRKEEPVILPVKNTKKQKTFVELAKTKKKRSKQKKLVIVGDVSLEEV
jgi:hypothetical protein